MDYDGDGALDLLVGATHVDAWSTDGGGVYVVFGPVSGTGSLATADVLLAGSVAGGYVGRGVRGEDFDGNGCGDLLIGAAGDDDGGNMAGAAYVSLGGPGE